jgi:hypothetical protein
VKKKADHKMEVWQTMASRAAVIGHFLRWQCVNVDIYYRIILTMTIVFGYGKCVTSISLRDWSVSCFWLASFVLSCETSTDS